MSDVFFIFIFDEVDVALRRREEKCMNIKTAN